MHKHVRAALTAVVAVTALAASTPAAMAAPKVPANCTFNGATGKTTCMTTVLVDNTQLVKHASDDFDLGGPTTDGSNAAQFCLSKQPNSYYYETQTEDATVSAVGSQTTTTTYQGAPGNGNKPTSTTTTSNITYSQGPYGALDCYVPKNDGFNGDFRWRYIPGQDPFLVG